MKGGGIYRWRLITGSTKGSIKGSIKNLVGGSADELIEKGNRRTLSPFRSRVCVGRSLEGNDVSFVDELFMKGSSHRRLSTTLDHNIRSEGFDERVSLRVCCCCVIGNSICHSGLCKKGSCKRATRRKEITGCTNAVEGVFHFI